MRNPNKVSEMLQKAWKLRQRIRKRRKREDKSRRSSPATAAVPELGDRERNERREECAIIKATTSTTAQKADHMETKRKKMSQICNGRGGQTAGHQTGRTARGTWH